MESVCKNCHADLLGKYCKDCGQKNYQIEDKSLKHIVEEAVHFTTHFEGTFFTTLKTVLLKPGKLSLDYCAGIRKKYYKPISFFLILIVIYLIFPVLEGLNMRMDYYKSNAFYGHLATTQIDEKVATLKISEAELSEIFQAKSEKVSKIMLLLLIPLTAGLLWLLYFKSKKPAFDHFIFATESNIFTVLILFLLWPLLLTILHSVTGVAIDDSIGAIILSLAYFFYLFAALFRFYQERWAMTLVKSIQFVGLYALVLQVIYKYLLFQATFMLI